MSTGVFFDQQDSLAVLVNSFLSNLPISIIRKVASSSKLLQVTVVEFFHIKLCEENKREKKDRRQKMCTHDRTIAMLAQGMLV